MTIWASGRLADLHVYILLRLQDFNYIQLSSFGHLILNHLEFYIQQSYVLRSNLNYIIQNIFAKRRDLTWDRSIYPNEQKSFFNLMLYSLGLYKQIFHVNFVFFLTQGPPGPSGPEGPKGEMGQGVYGPKGRKVRLLCHIDHGDDHICYGRDDDGDDDDENDDNRCDGMNFDANDQDDLNSCVMHERFL